MSSADSSVGDLPWTVGTALALRTMGSVARPMAIGCVAESGSIMSRRYGSVDWASSGSDGKELRRPDEKRCYL